MRVLVVCVNSYFSYSVNTSFLMLIFWKKKVLIPLFVIVISNILIVFTNKNITKIMLSLYFLHILQSFAASLENKNAIVTKQLYLNRFAHPSSYVRLSDIMQFFPLFEHVWKKYTLTLCIINNDCKVNTFQYQRK